MGRPIDPRPVKTQTRFVDWMTGLDIVNGPFGVNTEPVAIHPA